MPLSLGHETSGLPPNIREIIVKARTSWLKNTEVMELLRNHEAYGLPVGREAPDCPGGGNLFLFNRKAVRFFRKDGHEWRKKADGKTVRETHEKLKIDNKDALNCYYAHAEAKEALQRRCYWLLDGEGDIVLVHYLSSSSPARQPAAASSGLSGAPSSNRRSNAQAGHSLSRAGSLPLCLEPSALQQAVTITTGEAPRVQLFEMLSNGSCTSSQQPASASHLPPQIALEMNPRAASSPVPGDDLLSALSCGLPFDGSLDRKRTRGMLRSVPSAFAGVLPGSASSYSHWQSIRQDSRHSSQSGATDLSFATDPLSLGLDLQMHLPRSSVGRFPPRQSGLGRQGLPPLAVEQSEPSAEMQRLGSEVGETYELKPAVSLTRVDSDTLKLAPSLSRATSSMREPGSAGRPTESRSGATSPLPSSTVSPFFAAAFTGNPIRVQKEAAAAPKDVSSEDDVVPRWHSTSALAHMRQYSNERAASTTASDLGRLDLERRSSKRHRSGLLSGRLSGGSMASEPQLHAGLPADTPQSIFGDLPMPGSKSLGHVVQGVPLDSLQLNWQIPTGKVGFEGQLPAWRGESFPHNSMAMSHLLPEPPLLPEPVMTHLPAEPVFPRVTGAETVLPLLPPGDLDWDLRFLH